MRVVINKLTLEIDFESINEETKLWIYNLLSYRKRFAIKRCYREYYNIPLEIQDLESIAWLAFEETLSKFERQHGFKDFDYFFMDNVYWRCKDYCKKFTNNRHRILNIAETKYFYRDWYPGLPVVELTWDRDISLQQYYEKLPDSDKKAVFSLLGKQYKVKEIANRIYCSRSKVYRTINILAKDLKSIV